MAVRRRALADTSVFVATETVRPLARDMPTHIAVSIVTVAELRLGVLAALGHTARAQRLETLRRAESLEPVPVDDAVASAWARLRVDLRAAGRRIGVNDSWIAATALALAVPVLTQDADYDGVPGLEVIRL